jgi:hypothetical protein
VGRSSSAALFTPVNKRSKNKEVVKERASKKKARLNYAESESMSIALRSKANLKTKTKKRNISNGDNDDSTISINNKIEKQIQN